MNHSEVVRCLCVEDEPMAMQTLERLIDQTEGLSLCGVAETGTEAVRSIDRLSPDVLFLDIRIPHFSGLEVLRRIQKNPRVVFTTAYDEYAIAAFELGAVDYLLKPFGPKRFALAVDRIEQAGLWAEAREVSARLQQCGRDSAAGLERFFLRRREKIVLVSVAEVIRFEARGDYVAVITPDHEDLISLSLSELELRLDPVSFLRVHRSCLVHFSHIERIVPYDDRRLKIIFKDGSSFVASRQGSFRIRQLVK